VAYDVVARLIWKKFKATQKKSIRKPNGRPKLYISIDADGTIWENRWPNIGPFRFKAVPMLKWLKQQGHVLILNTCREEKRLLHETLDYKGEAIQIACSLLWEAKLVFKENDIEFDYYNENPPELIEKFGGDCRKIAADLYLEDGVLWPLVPLRVLWKQRQKKRRV
jgi:hypothetical protein